jgi:hypothetical protein
MSNQVSSITLQSAVLMQTKEFATNNQKFSVFDITRTIREKTAAGDLEIPEVEVSGASFRFDIPHAKVKSLFDELWSTGVFDSEFTLTRQFNGMYFEYTPSPITVASTVNYNGATIQTPSIVPIVAPASPSAPVTPVSTTNALPNEIQERVETYLDNCITRNFRPTLKQVQSAIKRGEASTGFSCEMLKTFIMNYLGYTIVDDPDSLSRSQVAVI